jgi:hypothetical protein
VRTEPHSLESVPALTPSPPLPSPSRTKVRPRCVVRRLVASLAVENVDDVIFRVHQRLQEAPLPIRAVLLSQFVGMVAAHAATNVSLAYVRM